MMTNGNTRKLTPAPSKTDSDMSHHFFDDTDVHSPTDSSEDSVEVKITPISSLRNKRKCSEPRKVHETSTTTQKTTTFSGPLKKRMCLKVKAELEEHNNTTTTTTPFRPWSPKPSHGGYFRPPSPVVIEQQPVALIAKKTSDSSNNVIKSSDCSSHHQQQLRVPIHPPVAQLGAEVGERMIRASGDSFPALGIRRGTSAESQRNYKNMTRERRIEANARERTRVHTISAAFDTLRKSVPAYSHSQKLSKLSVLRIACSYIMTLSNIVSGDEEAASECVDLVTKTIQREGKLRRKKDDND